MILPGLRGGKIIWGQNHAGLIPLAAVAFLGFIVLFVSFATAQEATSAFRAGAASIDITPQEGVLRDGTIMKIGPVRGVHDRLFSRAVVLAGGRTTTAIAVNDACMIERSVFDRAKAIAHRETGIPPAHMLMSATHSHAAVRAMHIGEGPLDDEYHEFLARQIAAAVIAAHGNLAPARLGFGSFDRPELVSCRRFVCRPGTVSPNPFGDSGERVKSVSGSSNGVLGSAGQVDPQVSVLSLQHTDGSPLAVLANFSVHYCGGYRSGWVSADYFGAFAARLEEQLGTPAGRPAPVAMMSNGTSGDTSSIGQLGKRYAPFEHLEAAGRQLADATWELIRPLEHQVPDGLAARYSELELGVRRPSAERLAWARTTLAEPSSAELPHRWSRIYAREALALSEYPEQYRLPLQAFRIGDVGIAAIPCEVFAETGLVIKRDSPLPKTFTVELANGYGGYLPTAEQHRLGGYETWPARSSHLEVDAEGKIRAEILRLLQATCDQPKGN
jgi:hypothetical protein